MQLERCVGLPIPGGKSEVELRIRETNDQARLLCNVYVLRHSGLSLQGCSESPRVFHLAKAGSSSAVRKHDPEKVRLPFILQVFSKSDKGVYAGPGISSSWQLYTRDSPMRDSPSSASKLSLDLRKGLALGA